MLHSRARHLLVHTSLCLPANIFSLFLPYFYLFAPALVFTSLRISPFISLSLFLFLLRLRFIYRYHLFLYHLTCAIPTVVFSIIIAHASDLSRGSLRSTTILEHAVIVRTLLHTVYRSTQWTQAIDGEGGSRV